MPHGLSMIMSRNPNRTDFKEVVIEFIFELVRQLKFPDAPSRLTSLYGIETIEQAARWKDVLHGQASDALWEIEYEADAPVYDASLLNVDPDQVWEGEFSCFLTMENAYRYWAGERTENSLPELLITPPVTIVRQLT